MTSGTTTTGTVCKFGEDGMPKDGNCGDYEGHHAFNDKRVRVRVLCVMHAIDPFDGEIVNPSIYVDRVGSAATVVQDPEANAGGMYMVAFDDGVVGCFCAGELDLV